MSTKKVSGRKKGECSRGMMTMDIKQGIIDKYYGGTKVSDLAREYGRTHPQYALKQKEPLIHPPVLY